MTYADLGVILGCEDWLIEKMERGIDPMSPAAMEWLGANPPKQEAKKAKPGKALPHVLCDQREQAPLVFSSAVTTERVLLPVGDYSLRGATDSVAIERKRGGELASCCGVDRERFLAQVERMRGFPVAYVVVEATMSDMLHGIYRSNINPLSVIGTVVKICSDWKIPVLFCGDARDTALVVERILFREHKRLEEATREKR